MNKTYKKCECGSDCIYFDDNINEPCWGPVSAIDEVYDGDDWGWIHVCRGHGNVYDGGEYIPENK